MINSLATMGMSFITGSKGLPVILFLIIVFTKCQSRVVVSEWKTDNKLFLNCSVCELVHDVILYSPSSYPVSFNSRYFAICQADSHNKGVRKCTDPNVSQDFATHTTSFMIGDVNVFKEYGIWTCRHGSDQGHIELKPPESESECEDKLAACWRFSAVLPMFTILSIVLNVYFYCKRRKGSCLQLRKTNLRRAVPRINVSCVKGQSTEYDQHKGRVQKDTETQSEKDLLIKRQPEDADSFSGFTTCHSCKHFWPNSVCINCKTEYCGTCLESHNSIYPAHNVLNKIDTNELEINCGYCQDKKASMICKKCNANLCKICADKHNHNISEQLTGSTRKCCGHKDIEYIRNILMPAEKGVPTRICGIAFLVDNRIVVVENGCYRVSVFEIGELKFKEDLSAEPRGITGMTKNNIAITFGFNMLIKIYNVQKNSLSETKTIDLRSFGLGNIKPFSISFDENHFAVEAGEGDDGVILIIDENGGLKRKIVNINNLIFFTGNTIRLALDMTKKRVYISEISKKAVSCITFSGRIVWNVPMQSPRSVVFIPPGEIICASKCCDGIFRLCDEDGKYDILDAKCAEGKITGSRYIAYHSGERLLCIQHAQVTMDYKNQVPEELRIYKYSKS